MYNNWHELYNSKQFKSINDLIEKTRMPYISEIQKSVSNCMTSFTLQNPVTETVTSTINAINYPTTGTTAIQQAMKFQLEMCHISEQSSKNMLKEVQQAIQAMASPIKISQQISEITTNIVSDTINKIRFKMPKFNIPKISPDALDRWEFMDIVSDCNIPVYFETDTELQNRVLEICRYSGEDYPIREVEACVMDYYNDNRIDEILEYWINQDWIESDRKEGFKEAIEDYKNERYWGTSCILMTQIGGVITRLYNMANMNKLVPLEEKKELLKMYNVGRFNSEKAKGIVMISMQHSGIYGWEKFANYFVNVVYSNKDDLKYFLVDPGRNKTCHGDQLNLGNRIIALKCILILDMIIQMSEDLFESVA